VGWGPNKDQEVKGADGAAVGEQIAGPLAEKKEGGGVLALPRKGGARLRNGEVAQKKMPKKKTPTSPEGETFPSSKGDGKFMTKDESTGLK